MPTLEDDGALFSFAEADETGCAFDLPAGAFGADADTPQSVHIDAYRYDANHTSTTSGLNLECTNGGASPTEVFDNAVSCITESEESSGRGANVIVDRSLGDGFVSNGTVFAIFAAPDAWWYDFTLSNVEPRTEFGPALTALAHLMLDHGHGMSDVEDLS